MNNIGIQFVKLAVRIFILYGLYVSFINTGLLSAVGVIATVAMAATVSVYISVDMNKEKAIMKAGPVDVKLVENKTVLGYIVSFLCAVIDTSILYFLLHMKIVAVVYGLCSIAFLLFVYEHQKAILTIRKREKSKNEQTNSVHG